MTYCAIAALSLLGRLDVSGLQSIDGLTRWLVHRQVPFEGKDEMDDDEWQDILEKGTEEEKAEGTRVERGVDGRPIWGGFHGRCNKKADTCYSFWVGASLEVGSRDFLPPRGQTDTDARRIDVEETLPDRHQCEPAIFARKDEARNRWIHEAAAARRKPRFVPRIRPACCMRQGLTPNGGLDILHSFLGLAALALMREEGVNRLDAALCMSMQAKERLMAFGWWAEGR
jgi:geranylgeranyl transferase type-1 subunit beta